MKTRSPISTLSAVCLALAVGLALAVPASAKTKTVNLAAGSIDGLAAAIAAAGSGGTVVVKSGTHTESGIVVVSFPVSIVGEEDAVIECGTSPGQNYPIQIDATIHIKNTRNVKISGLEFRPPSGGTANTAVLIERSSNVNVTSNTTSDFQFGVIVDYGNNNNVSQNMITSTTRWQLDPSDPNFLPETDGIIVLNGRSAQVMNNDISSALFGFMGCIDTGAIMRNMVSDCYGGILFCKVPDESYVISGNTEGGHPGGTHWNAQKNTVVNNYWGFLLTDGANNNSLIDNIGSGNFYDIELAGDTSRFGFPTPASFHDFVQAKSPLVVKDCGNNDVIKGNVILVDHNADPCY